MFSMAVRYSIVAGTVGFLSGMLFRDKKSLNAAQYIQKSEPMDIEDTGDVIMETVKHGFPSLDSIRARKSFVLSYDRRNRVPNWVLEYLTRDKIKYDANINRSKSEFFEDQGIHPFFRSSNEDYKGSGFDRGHLAAAGNHRSQQDLLDDTFVLSNVAPQVGAGFNRDIWNDLEKRVRQKVRVFSRGAYVCSGPLYLPRLEEDGKKYVKYQVIGPHDVAVPTHFFKIIVLERSDGYYNYEAYIIPNAPIDKGVPLKAFKVPKDVIERAAGLLFFEKIPDKAFIRINGDKV